ncbi:hypothetical protein JCM8547_000880 [Rhodosporidiobolus lusitaniae]
MFSRTITSSSSALLRTTAPTSSSSRLFLASSRALSSSVPRQAGSGQPAENSHRPDGSPVTSTSHPTVPHPPKPDTPFFARKNIGLEVTPLLAFVATIATLGISFGVKNFFFDDGIQHRHGVEVDDKLKEVLEKK